MSSNMDIFDQISSESTQKEDLFDQVISEQPSRTRSLASAYPKGLAKGTQDFVSFLQTVPGIGGGGGPISAEMFGKQLDSLLPTQDQTPEKFLERAGKLTPAVIGGPESLLAKGARTALGAAGGQAIEELGGPEWLQNVAELSPGLSPKFGKNLIPKNSQKEAVAFLRGKGLSDKEITPLLQSERKLKYLSKIAKGEGKAVKLSQDISEKLGKEYETLKDKPFFMKNQDLTKFDDSLNNVIDKINPRFSRLIENDLRDFRNQGVSTKSLIDLYQDINATVKGQEGGKAVLGKIKPAIVEGLKKIDPKIADDFENLNKFYSKNKQFYKSIKPSAFDSFLSKSKLNYVIGAIAALNFPILAKGIAIKEGSALLAREVLINPRLQNLSNQMLKSIKDNKISLTYKLFDQYKNELKKTGNEDLLKLINQGSKDPSDEE